MSENHQQPELEFAAKRVNDLLRELFPDRRLEFMSFIFDSGDGEYMGYLSSIRRIDAYRAILEWQDRVLHSFKREDIRKLLIELEKELAKEEEQGPPGDVR